MIKTLNDLFYETLRDMFYAEKKILRTLPKLAKAVTSDELREAFLHHRDETEGQVERIERVFEIIGRPARGKTCDAIDGILAEGSEVMEDVRATRHWMQVSSLERRRSSTMRSLATAR